MTRTEQDHSVSGVVIALLTFRRNDDLDELLPMLVDQAGGIPEPVSITVIDNDPDGGAREAVQRFGGSLVRYVHEEAPGIANARNRALDEAAGEHLLVFIDDDERPHPGWLAAMVDTYRRYGSAGVVGSVVADSETLGDPWLDAGSFFVRKRYRTGTEMPAAGTGNLLLDLRQVELYGPLRFDLAFGLTGGSDTMFTRSLRQQGGRLVWCDEATITDKVPVERLTREWVLQRAFRSGNSWSRTSIALETKAVSKLGSRIQHTGKGITRIVAGLVRSVVGTITGSLRHQARGSRTVARGLGMLLGAWGVVYQEYGRKDAGSS